MQALLDCFASLATTGLLLRHNSIVSNDDLKRKIAFGKIIKTAEKTGCNLSHYMIQ